MRAYWWAVKPNFGDLLTPFLLEGLLGVEAEWAAPSETPLVVVGSVLDVLPESWTGIIAGAGKLHERTAVPPFARVLGLRGALTARSYRGDFALGDPGLLVDEMIAPQEKIHNLGLIPHWTDRGTQALEKRFAHLDPHFIDPMRDPLYVATEVAKCKKIVSSSLHGIILADAFGIPRRAEMFPMINSHHEGGVFKFEDYATVTGLPIEFGKLQEPSRQCIERVQADLFDMFDELGSIIRNERADQHPRSFQGR